MFENYMLLLLLGHILGDFYVQTKTMSNKKDANIKWVYIHGLSYWVTMLIVILPVFSWEMIMSVTFASILHCLIDVCKYGYKRNIGKNSVIKDRNIFIIDQILHFICLVFVSYYMTVKEIRLDVLGCVEAFFDTLEMSESRVLTWLMALLLLHKPANIFIQKILVPYKPVSGEKENNTANNVGRFIGTLERFIMLIFISLNQYASIGLVLTAKSIARYDKISKEKDFAEYYLLGTLLSVIVVMLTAIITGV